MGVRSFGLSPAQFRVITVQCDSFVRLVTLKQRGFELTPTCLRISARGWESADAEH